mgnify:FL=1
MKFINYSIIGFILSFLALAFFIEPITYTDEEEKDFFYEIPEVNLNMPLSEELITENGKDVDSYFPEHNFKKDSVQAWTVKVNNYDDLDVLTKDLIVLKDLGYKVYSRYGEKDKKYVLFIGPTLKKEDSSNILTSLNTNPKFNPEIVRYD